MAIHEGIIMRGPNSKLIPIFTFFLLLASPTIQTLAQEHREVVYLYRRALEETRGPIQLEDFRAVELKTATDYNDIAQLCIDGERYDKALEAIEGALDLDPFNPVANLHAGLVHYKLGEYQKAAYHLEWALRAGRAQKIRDTRLGEELLSGPANNPPKANPSIMGLLNKARERSKDQEAARREGVYPLLETEGHKGPSYIPLVRSGSQLEQGLPATKTSGFAYPFGEQSQGTLRTHGDLSTGAIIKKGKEKSERGAVKATLKEDRTQTNPSPRKKKRSSSESPSQALPGPPNKKAVKSAAIKEGEQEGAERFVLQPFNPGRK